MIPISARMGINFQFSIYKNSDDNVKSQIDTDVYEAHVTGWLSVLFTLYLEQSCIMASESLILFLRKSYSGT